jgi:hypothetical protein
VFPGIFFVGHTGEAFQLWRTPIDSIVELRHLSAIDRDVLPADSGLMRILVTACQSIRQAPTARLTR